MATSDVKYKSAKIEAGTYDTLAALAEMEHVKTQGSLTPAEVLASQIISQYIEHGLSNDKYHRLMLKIR